LDPPFFTTDLGVIINVRKWNSLSDKSKEILQRVMIEHELWCRSVSWKGASEKLHALSI
jgi:TRAP-type C4-dicarboxylate transport system substrate-binding protein